jgi:16S rRNA (guanine1516-N2)-methyltransferase
MNNKLKMQLQVSEDYTALPLATLQALLLSEIAAHTDTGSPAVQLQLNADANGLSLQDASVPNAAATRVDFVDPTLQYRLRTSGKRQGLGKAIGLDKAASGQQVFVVDATAGLGRDALVLAHLGCRVLLLEQSPLMHALLADGLRRGNSEATPEFASVLTRMQLLHADARQWLAAAARGEHERPDVVYLDPMFPPRDKQAKVKKDIALLHQLLGSEQDLGSLLRSAQAVARYRVVLKRPAGKLPPDLPAPTLWVGEKPAAFAVYVNSSFSSMR